MKFEPYENENIVFIDTEFSDLDPYKGEILSVGMVKLNGDEFYAEVECEGSCSEWVKKHIVPTLKEEKIGRDELDKRMREFLGEENPFVVAFVDNYDVIYLTKVFGAGNLPFRWTTIDFSSVLFALGVNPVKFLADEKGAMNFYRKLGINIGKYRKHHALDDSRLLRDVWLKMTDATAPAKQNLLF